VVVPEGGPGRRSCLYGKLNTLRFGGIWGWFLSYACRFWW
jgi:hypothetical protein